MARASQKFDRQLFTLKLSQLSGEMQTKSVASDKKASAASRTTGGPLLLNIVNGQLALLGEWLRNVDLTARTVWQTQGEPITPDFVRDVLVPEAMTLIAVRDSVIKSRVELVVMRTRLKNAHDALRHLAMKIRKLKGEVANGYEIEARELQYQKAAAQGSSESQLLEGGIGGRRRGWTAAALGGIKRPLDRRSAVDAYIQEVLEKTGRKITRADFWRAAGYKTRTEFERWQRCDPKHKNEAADKAFTRILTKKPHLK
jgi:hypothetical protein